MYFLSILGRLVVNMRQSILVLDPFSHGLTVTFLKTRENLLQIWGLTFSISFCILKKQIFEFISEIENLTEVLTDLSL
jgi:hypothetical protein